MRKLKTHVRLLLSSILGKNFSRIPSSVLKDSRIVSFDVFDTLVFRTVPTPSDLFDLLSVEPDFKKRRIAAERRARESVKGEAKGEDVSLDAIYQYLPGDNPQDEIEKELEVCYANPKALKVFHRIRKDFGKKVIIISDMYLPRKVIEQILTNCGYDLRGVEVYVSSEYGLTKRSGNLFKAVLKKEGVKPSEVLHIGDNLLSDYLMPRKVGLRSFLYHSRRG